MGRGEAILYSEMSMKFSTLAFIQAVSIYSAAQNWALGI